MKQRFFITGTDTDIGKTHCAVEFCQWMRKQGTVLYIKAIQTGANEFSDTVFSDCDVVCQSVGHEVTCTSILSFEIPASPHLAAREEGFEIELETLIKNIETYEALYDCDYTVIEGAGGVAVPINSKGEDMLDLCLDLKAQPILVIANKLGCINHAILSLKYLQTGQFDQIDYILNHPSKIQASNPDQRKQAELILQDNAQVIKDQFECEPLLNIAFQP